MYVQSVLEIIDYILNMVENLMKYSFLPKNLALLKISIIRSIIFYQTKF